MKSNLKEKDDVCYAQPKTVEQRVAIASDFTQRFKYSVPLRRRFDEQCRE